MSTNVCADQATYDAAFQHAVDRYQNRPQSRTMAVLSVIMLFFTIWAVLLAMKVKDKEQRILHFIFAFLLGPIYVICYYSSMFTKDDRQ